MRNKLAQAIVLSGVTTSFLCAAPVMSETDEQNRSIETVNVVGTRQAYQGQFSALETPQANLTIDAQVLRNAGAIDLNQALDLSASVARQNNFGGLWNSFAIRGFVGDENLPSNYLVNGFNAGRGFGGPRDLSGIESVEILRGPRAALFGRGEPGGTINLVTKRPTFQNVGEIGVSAGSFDTYRTDMDLDYALSDNVAIRIVGFYEDAKSYRDTVETKKQGLTPSIAVNISDATKLVYELEYNEQEIPFDRGVIAVNGKLGEIPESRFLGEPGYGPIETEVLGHQLELQHDLNDQWSALVGFNYRDTSLEGFASENGFGTPDDNGEFNRFTRYRDYDTSYYVLRAELSGNFEALGLKHKLVVGVDVDEFENDQLALRDRSTDQRINIFNPVYGQYPISSLSLPVQIDRVETQESLGFYVQDQISLTDKLDVRIGARFDDYDQELVNRRLQVNDSDRTITRSEDQVSPQLGVVYKVNETVSLYTVYGENFRPLSGDLDANNSESIEAGVKFTLNDGALEGVIAVYDVEQSNISTVSDSFDPTAIGEASSRGVEVDLTGQITDTLSIRLSYAYTDAETENAFNDPNFGTEVPAGSDLINIPRNQFSLQFKKDTFVSGKKLSFIGNLIHVDARNGFFSVQDFRLPAYTTVNIGAIYEVSESLELHAEINNIFEEEYYTNSFSNTWVQPGTPLNGRISATYRF